MLILILMLTNNFKGGVVINELKRLENEAYLDYILRLAELKRLGKIGYDELGDLLLGEQNVYSSDNIRKFWYLFDKITEKIQYDVSVLNKDINEVENNSEYKDILKTLEEKKIEIQKERYKLQTEKIELNKWIREDARNELFMEKIIDAIKSENTNCKNILPIEIKQNNREYLLCLADAHFAKEFKIYGLNDEIINEYSPEIFYKRMEIILSETIDFIKKESVSKLKVFSLGDGLEGFLRYSQIWNLRYGVVESSIIYGKYMAEWFKQLSKHVYVEYHSTNGNHTSLRLLDGKKDEHLNENIEDIIVELISIKNEDNSNFKVISNKTGLIFTNICGFNVVGVHGEFKNGSQALKDFSDIYNTPINIIVSGHKHHGNLVNCGYRKQAIGIGSIVGSDDFSMRIKKQADATANIITFEIDKGKVNDYTIVLN